VEIIINLGYLVCYKYFSSSSSNNMKCLVDWVRDVRGSLLLLFLEGVLIIGPWVDIDFGHCTTTAVD